MSVMRLAAYVDAGAGVPLRRAFLYVVLLLVSNLATFLLSSSYSSCTLHPAVTAAPTMAAPTNAAVPEEPGLPLEFHAFAGPHALPYGRNPNMGTAELRPPMGHPCLAFPDLLAAFLSYPANGSCPDDELPAQRLMLRGCEPLPRRRCRPAAPRDPAPPLPFPDALWSTPPDRSVHWSAYTCKSFRCLVDRARSSRFDDCKDCFDLAGRERHRWLNATGKKNPLDFSIDEVLASASPPGSIRIGLDVGGGSGTFAVRMRERGVTVVATTVNLNGPFSTFVAARGIVPLYVSVAARLPFFDNTLDIVHSMHVLSGWIPPTALQFALFDVYRVLRPGGLFWLDHFFCGDAEAAAYVEVVESVGFRKVRWVTGSKLDRGPERKEMYVSALLEKPLKNSW
ncbi:probable methyltransferase At1g29790 [Phragmites australis]|uniref:probable methyltransferase At1g29790 n=1 Tax=Phragmites australis TaxID=29695 RepID=UPI002D765E4C|nr:probable methyltransferase At1g29790 [Phragmites australis]